MRQVLKWGLSLFALALAAPAARAQQAVSICVNQLPPYNSGVPSCWPVTSSNPLPVTGGGSGGSTVVTQPTAGLLNATVVGTGTFAVQSTPPGILGFGTLAATNTSTLVSTLTVGPNSAAWPTTPGQVYVINQGTASIYVCPLGGTCAASGANEGILIPASGSYGFAKPSTNMTLISPTAGSVQVQF